MDTLLMKEGSSPALSELFSVVDIILRSFFTAPDGVLV
jgi:hypothetical protein